MKAFIAICLLVLMGCGGGAEAVSGTEVCVESNGSMQQPVPVTYAGFIPDDFAEKTMTFVHGSNCMLEIATLVFTCQEYSVPSLPDNGGPGSFGTSGTWRITNGTLEMTTDAGVTMTYNILADYANGQGWFVRQATLYGTRDWLIYHDQEAQP